MFILVAHVVLCSKPCSARASARPTAGMPSAPTLCNCLCGAPLVAFASIATMLVALAALDGVAGVNHWVATERAGIIVPKVPQHRRRSALVCFPIVPSPVVLTAPATLPPLPPSYHTPCALPARCAGGLPVQATVPADPASDRVPRPRESAHDVQVRFLSSSTGSTVHPQHTIRASAISATHLSVPAGPALLCVSAVVSAQTDTDGRPVRHPPFTSL